MDLHNIGFGGASITSMFSYSSALDLLEEAYRLGIRHFDTAPLYGQGYSEVIFGNFIKNKRKEISISTKFGLGEAYRNKMPVQLLIPLNYLAKKFKKQFLTQENTNKNEYKPLTYRTLNKKEVKASFESSLTRLQTDYVDLYLIHEGLPTFLTDECLQYLLDLREQGRVKKLGIASNIRDIAAWADDEFKHWDVLQYEGRLHDNLVNTLLTRYPAHLHIHHSCLKSIQTDAPAHILPDEKAAYILAKCMDRNHKGKIVFSTRNLASLRSNMRFLQQHG